MTAPSGVRCVRAMWTTVEDTGLLPQLAENGSRWPKVCSDAPCDKAIACSRMYGITNFLQKVGRLCTEAADNEAFSPGFAVHGRAGEASLQVSAISRWSVECRLAGACAEEPRSKSLTTRCRPGQRRRPHPRTDCGCLVRKPQWVHHCSSGAECKRRSSAVWRTAAS